jgi:hypothetical protein
MTTTVINDHFFLRYRELLDAEDHAFDELEHACEDGDGPHFNEEMVEWVTAVRAKLAFLARSGIELSVA